MKRRLIVLHTGQTHVAVEYTTTLAPALIVTNDGITWAARSVPFHALASEMASMGIELRRMLRSRGGATLDAEYRLPLDWARRQAPAVGTTVSTPAKAVASAVSMPGEVRLPSGRVVPTPVTYVGFEAVRRASAHTLEALHAAVMRALEVTAVAWPGWVPDGVEVRFHDSTKALGLAFAPGRGLARKISLHKRLLAEYDALSVWRVMLHELCHHWREERWGVTREAHDRKFCEQLALVDPAASDPRTCQFFTGEVDPAIVTAKAEKAAKRMADVTWSPEAGTLAFRLLASGQIRLDWIANPAWHWRTVTIPLNDSELLGFVGHFAPADWSRVVVSAWPASLDSRLAAGPKTLVTLLEFFLQRFKLPKFRAYVDSLSKGPVSA